MGAAAFSAMFSTCITVLDGYARSLDRAWAAAMDAPRSVAKHRGAVVLVAGGALGIVLAFRGQLKVLVDLATTLSFLVAPLIAWWNLKLVTSDQMPAEARPPKWLQGLGVARIGLPHRVWRGVRLGQPSFLRPSTSSFTLPMR